MSILSAPHFHNEEAAYAYVEARLWPQGPVCPHCGGVERISKMGGQSTRIGAYKCYQCRKPFTVKIGTVFEASHVPLRHWLQVMFLMASSKKGISANQVHRSLGCTLKTAWFICRRLREAMMAEGMDPFGMNGGGVEVDETYFGNVAGTEKLNAYQYRKTKHAVMTLVDRDIGRAYSRKITDFALTPSPILDEALSKKARLITDEAITYKAIGREYADHVSVNHSRGEYVNRHDVSIHTNTVEGFFSVFKRGMKGIYQHCEGKHLHRYLAEFHFRYSNRARLGVDDVKRADIMLAGVVGKRLTYRPLVGEA